MHVVTPTVIDLLSRHIETSGRSGKVTLSGALAELAKRHDVHPNMISQWKQKAKENLADVFDNLVPVFEDPGYSLIEVEIAPVSGATEIAPHLGVADVIVDLVETGETLRQNGYSTAAFGKWHETPTWEVSVSGPFFRWPTNSGFDKFYGFIGGETNQWDPVIFDGVTKVQKKDDPNYHFTTDMTNEAIEWVKFQQAMTPEKPFMIYYATGAVHAPHHAPDEWIEKYKGRFDDGWLALREQTIARQKKMGIVPKSTELAPMPKDIKDWEALSDKEQQLFALQMETFAGFAEHTDVEVGRLVDAIDEIGELDNTLFIYIMGDNGSSAEGDWRGPSTNWFT